MGECQSKTKRELPDIAIKLEKTLQQCLSDKDDYKVKYEDCNRRYEDIKSQLEKTLRTVKHLQRQLKLSEENASSLYRRYAIESDLNKRLKMSQKTTTEDTCSWKHMGNTSCDIRKRLDNFEGRICHIESTLEDTSNSYSNLVYSNTNIAN